MSRVRFVDAATFALLLSVAVSFVFAVVQAMWAPSLHALLLLGSKLLVIVMLVGTWAAVNDISWYLRRPLAMLTALATLRGVSLEQQPRKVYVGWRGNTWLLRYKGLMLGIQHQPWLWRWHVYYHTTSSKGGAERYHRSPRRVINDVLGLLEQEDGGIQERG